MAIDLEDAARLLIMMQAIAKSSKPSYFKASEIDKAVDELIAGSPEIVDLAMRYVNKNILR